MTNSVQMDQLSLLFAGMSPEKKARVLAQMRRAAAQVNPPKHKTKFGKFGGKSK